LNSILFQLQFNTDIFSGQVGQICSQMADPLTSARSQRRTWNHRWCLNWGWKEND